MWRTILRVLAYNILICWLIFGDQEEVTSREVIWSVVFIVGLNIGGLWFVSRRLRPDRQIAPRSTAR